MMIVVVRMMAAVKAVVTILEGVGVVGGDVIFIHHSADEVLSHC